MSTTTIDRLRDTELSHRATLVGGAASAFLLITLLGPAFPGSIRGNLLVILTSRGIFSSALRLSIPIMFAALGGIFSRKAGVVNIGLEGLLIISVFTAVITTVIVGPEVTVVDLPTAWIDLFAGILSSVLFSALFAVIYTRLEADQTTAGLAV